MKDLRIVIVSWNVEKLLERCLKSLPEACEGLDWEVVVVDNASNDASVETAQRIIQVLLSIFHLPSSTFQVIANPDNRGFARACNQGIAGSEARYTLLLNPDTECPRGSLTALVKLADARPEAGIIGPKITYPDGRYQQSVRGFPSFWSQAGILLKLHHLMPWLPTFRRYFRDDLMLHEGTPSVGWGAQASSGAQVGTVGEHAAQARQAEQVMGACFLIRREVIEKIGGLDERYFIWFEEVDYCHMAKVAGWPTLYASSVSIIHHGGQSFDQIFSVKKQQMFSESMLKYFQKWQPGWRPLILGVLRPLSIWLSWLVGMLRRSSSPQLSISSGREPVERSSTSSDCEPVEQKRGSIKMDSTDVCRGNDKEGGDDDNRAWLFWLASIVALEAISLATYEAPLFRTVAAVLVAFLVFGISVRRPDIGLAALLAELAIGSKGALFKIGLETDPNVGIPLRMALFGAFILGWVINKVANYEGGVRMIRITNIKERLPWLVLAALTIYAFIRGLVLGNGSVLKDANAWGFLFLLIPVIDVAHRDGRRLIRHATHALIAALVWLPLKILATLYVFSHGLQPASDYLYYWFRRTGVGEPTHITGTLFRMFLQSQIYAAGVVMFGAAKLCHSPDIRRGNPELMDPRLCSTGSQPELAEGRGDDRKIHALLALSIASILISLSRSMWMGLAAGGFVLLILALRQFAWRPLASAAARMIALALVAVGLIASTVFFPFPRVDVGSLSSLFGSRGSLSDDAAKSRWELLPAMWGKIKQAPILGHGFGATVTYTSFDPRVRSGNAQGTYTTYAFEWGWVDHWLKFGVLGIPVMLWLVASLCRRIWRTDADWCTRAGLVSVLIMLGATHFFTPYLNHPLGFGLLLAAEGWITHVQTPRRSWDACFRVGR